MPQKRKKQRKSNTEKKRQPKVSHPEDESEEESTPGDEQADTSIISRANEVSPQIRRVSSANLDVPFLKQFSPESYQDNREAARELFKLLISPVDIDHFYTYVENNNVASTALMGALMNYMYVNMTNQISVVKDLMMNVHSTSCIIVLLLPLPVRCGSRGQWY